MTDHHDQLIGDLTELFDSTATDTDIPPLPLQEVLTRGEILQRVRRRRAAIWTATAAAVAVVAVSLPIALAGHGTRQTPPPAHPPTGAAAPTAGPASAAPTLAYLAGGALHVDGRTIPTAGKRLLSRGGTTYVTGSKSDPWSWSHLVDGRLVRVSTPHSDAQPWTGWQDAALSPDGTLLAVLTHPTQNTARITAYRTTDSHEIAHTDFDAPYANWTGGGDSVSELGIDGSDHIFWNVASPTSVGIAGGSRAIPWVWQPGKGGATQLGQPFTSDPHGEMLVTPAGPIVVGVSKSILGQNADGTWHQVARFDDPGDDSLSGTVWSPSGQTYARGPDHGDIVSTATGSTVTPNLPGTFRNWIGFENETDVLGVVTTGTAPELVRCEATTGNCAVIENLPEDWKSWQWATNGPPGPLSPPVTPGTDTKSVDPTTPYVQNGSSGPADASISGRIIREGGAVQTGSGQPRSVPLSEVAAAYAHLDPDGHPVGKPLVTARSSADQGGAFVMHLPAGDYFLVPQDAAGAAIGAAKHVRLDAGRVTTVELDVIVP